jgi:hypothetical protein
VVGETAGNSLISIVALIDFERGGHAQVGRPVIANRRSIEPCAQPPNASECEKRRLLTNDHTMDLLNPKAFTLASNRYEGQAGTTCSIRR